MSQYIETRDIVLTANQVSIQGGYGQRFLLIESSAPVDIVFTDQYQKEVGQAKNIQSGLSVAFDTPFSFVKITSQTAQNIKICFGSKDVEFNRLAGQVTANIIQGNTIGDSSLKVLSLAPSKVVDANSSYKRLIFTADKDNVGDIYIGGEDIDKDSCAIILSAGDSYIEAHCAIAEFWAVSDNDLSDKLRIGIGALS